MAVKVKTAADHNADLIARDRRMMMTPDDWPRYPLLPLVNRKGQWDDQDFTAFLLAPIDEKRPVIYFGNILLLRDIAQTIIEETGKNPLWTEVVAKHRSKEFASLDELVAAYRVD